MSRQDWQRRVQHTQSTSRGRRATLDIRGSLPRSAPWLWALVSAVPFSASMLDTLKISRKTVHPARAGRGDLDGLGEHAAGLALTPLGIEQVNVEREHHAGLKPVADHLDGFAVGRDGVMAEPRIFQ